MNTHNGYLAVDSQIDELDCCTGSCNQNQGRGQCECSRGDPPPLGVTGKLLVAASVTVLGCAIGLVLRSIA